MNNTKFHVDKENGVVVCIITMDEDDIIGNRIQKYDLWGVAWDSYRQLSKRFVGVAKCAPEDEFDETYGKRLAEYRACVKRQKYVNKFLRKYIGSIINNIDRLVQYGLLKDVYPPKEIN